jgi:hypothetical protein
VIVTDVLAYGADARDDMVNENALLAKLDAARQSLAAPFAPQRVDLVASVAETLLGPRRSTASGPAAHFAFWTRRAALGKLAASFAARVPQHALARPRGLVFRLPPQNVETVFLYSWALAYLAGNANIVRLPHEISARMRAIVDLFLERLEAAGDESQLFVHYPSQGDLGAKISARSDARVVWGGDAKVALFAPLPLRNGGKSIWFGDRFSFSTISGAALDGLDDAALRRSPRNSTTTCSSSTRWPARLRMRSMSSAKPRRIRRRSGTYSTHPRSNGRWTIPRAGSGTRSAR